MSIFDGVTGLFEEVFDCEVTHTPSGGAARPLRGIFREEPVVQDGLDGNDVLTVQPILKLQKADADGVSAGDTFEISDRPDKSYRVLRDHPTRSPASDRHVLFILTDLGAAE